MLLRHGGLLMCGQSFPIADARAAPYKSSIRPAELHLPIPQEIPEEESFAGTIQTALGLREIASVIA